MTAKPGGSSRRSAELEAADRLHSAAIRLLRTVRVQDVASGVGPARFSALSVLVFGGPKSLTELAAQEQVRAATMSRIVTGLQRHGLAVRERAADDARKIRVRATPKGRRVLQKGRRRRVRYLARRFKTLTPRQLRILREAAAILQRQVLAPASHRPGG